uniref:non-histone chromosomal protein HMG-14 isoform X2 n=1 Tax=Callithrix jacchus TaxID=9483 RepID=UPI0023DD1C31|nr:non-histone chromosomal protein HMG-14 isoform X2 [Callithrix jacchus]
MGGGGGRPGQRGGEPVAGDAGGGGGGLPIRFHPVLPPPPLWVSAARAAGGVAADRQRSFAKAFGAPRPAGTRHAPPSRQDAQKEGQFRRRGRQGRAQEEIRAVVSG